MCWCGWPLDGHYHVIDGVHGEHFQAFTPQRGEPTEADYAEKVSTRGLLIELRKRIIDTVYIPVSKGLIEDMAGNWSRLCRFRFVDTPPRIEVFDEPETAKLGLATSRELLVELISRLRVDYEIGDDFPECIECITDLENVLLDLDRRDRADYRTVTNL